VSSHPCETTSESPTRAVGAFIYSFRPMVGIYYPESGKIFYRSSTPIIDPLAVGLSRPHHYPLANLVQTKIVSMKKCTSDPEDQKKPNPWRVAELMFRCGFATLTERTAEHIRHAVTECPPPVIWCQSARRSVRRGDRDETTAPKRGRQPLIYC